jgi:hypothetical protein
MVLLCSLAAACDLGAGSTPTAATELTKSAPPTQTVEPPATPMHTEEPATRTAPAPPSATDTPPTQKTTATPSSQTDSWFGPNARLLFVSGDDVQADLLALNKDGTVTLVLQDVGQDVIVSPDGRRLGSVQLLDDGHSTLELRHIGSGAVDEVTPDSMSGLLRFVFDRNSRRLAYLDLGFHTDAGVPWAIVVVDLESGAVSRYDALMAGTDSEPLPGVPIGWTGQSIREDELLIDTFLPFTEGGWMGVWGAALPGDGASAPLYDLALRQVIPGAPAYSSRLFLAPDAQTLAFLARDPDYVPDNYYTEFYDLAVNLLRLGSLNDGALNTLVEANDGSALARAVAWSPTGERLLFGQGHYEGESFIDLVLRSTDLGGSIVTYGPLTLPALGGLLDLAWCDTSRAYYVTWDGGDGISRLLDFDLNTGVNTEINAGQRIEIVGCAPQ